ncbi:hypothetical protein CEK25_006078 [Fusarium fujikuroi]|nr:hypothetical protein CEK25_006078 [Fusarium fujikuroi]
MAIKGKRRYKDKEEILYPLKDFLYNRKARVKTANIDKELVKLFYKKYLEQFNNKLLQKSVYI